MTNHYIKKRIFTAILCFALLPLLAGAKPADTTKTAALNIQFVNYAGDAKLQLNTGNYENASKEPFSVSTFNYFVSNIRLTNVNGQEFIVPQKESYFLVRQDVPSSNLITVNVPEGEYTSITYTLGVDSLRSTMDVSERTGALDPSGGMANGMYWSWNSGYIFMKLEGNSDQVPADRTGQHKFRFHIGGFGGYNKPSLNNIKLVTLSLPKTGSIKVSEGKSNILTVKADVLKVLNGKTTISLAKNQSVMFGDFSSLVASNYQEMFSILSTENAR